MPSRILHAPPPLKKGTLGSLHVHHSPSPFHQPHRHADMEWSLVLGGTATYLVKNRRYDLKAGSLFKIPPVQGHLLTRESKDFSMWVLIFRPALFRKVASRKSATRKHSAVPGLWIRHVAPQVCRRLDVLLNEIQGSEANRPRFHSGLLFLLHTLEDMERESDVIPQGRSLHAAVIQVIDHLQEGTSNLSVREISERSGLGLSRLSELFKKETGATLARFRQMRMLERVLDLFHRHPEKRLYAHALECGFNNDLQFYRVFKKIKGRKPQDYEKEVRSGLRN